MFIKREICSPWHNVSSFTYLGPLCFTEKYDLLLCLDNKTNARVSRDKLDSILCEDNLQKRHSYLYYL